LEWLAVAVSYSILCLEIFSTSGLSSARGTEGSCRMPNLVGKADEKHWDAVRDHSGLLGAWCIVKVQKPGIRNHVWGYL